MKLGDTTLFQSSGQSQFGTKLSANLSGGAKIPEEWDIFLKVDLRPAAANLMNAVISSIRTNFRK